MKAATGLAMLALHCLLRLASCDIQLQYGNAGLGEINPGVPYTLTFQHRLLLVEVIAQQRRSLRLFSGQLIDATRPGWADKCCDHSFSSGGDAGP